MRLRCPVCGRYGRYQPDLHLGGHVVAQVTPECRRCGSILHFPDLEMVVRRNGRFELVEIDSSRGRVPAILVFLGLIEPRWLSESVDCMNLYLKAQMVPRQPRVEVHAGPVRVDV